MTVGADTPRERTFIWLGRAAMAGTIGGVGLGAGLRVAMRLAAVFEGEETSFTVGGTFFILLAGAAIGLIMGVLYGGVRRWVPGSGLVKGALFGFVLALVVDGLLLASSGSEARTIGSPIVNAATFGGSLVVLGIVMEWAWPRVKRKPQLLKAGAAAAAGSVAGTAVTLAVSAVGVARWMTDTPDGMWRTLGMFAGFAIEGLLLGGVLGLAYGLARRDRWWSPLVYSAGLVGLWLVVVGSAGDDGMSGPNVTEIVAAVSVALAAFGVATAWLTARLLRVPPVLVTPDRRIGG